MKTLKLELEFENHTAHPDSPEHELNVKEDMELESHEEEHST